MLADFIHLPEEVFDDMADRIKKVHKEAWIRCPCVDIVDETKERAIVRFGVRDSDVWPLESYSIH
jgi:hypothetical protein